MVNNGSTARIGIDLIDAIRLGDELCAVED